LKKLIDREVDTSQLGFESQRLSVWMKGFKKILSAGSNTPLKGAGFIWGDL